MYKEKNMKVVESALYATIGNKNANAYTANMHIPARIKKFLCFFKVYVANISAIISSVIKTSLYQNSAEEKSNI